MNNISQLHEYKVFNNRELLAKKVGEIWKNSQNTRTKDDLFLVSSPLSSTPLLLYKWIVSHTSLLTNWEKVRFVLMDELVEDENSYVSMNDPASYEGFAQRNLLSPLQDGTGVAIPVIKPALESIRSFHTDIDLLILALGVKGNYANVMPGTSFQTGWHIARLIPEFRQTHTEKESLSFADANFREYGMSLGPQQVLSAKHVVVMIAGSGKKELTQELLSYRDFDPTFPLSIIFHPDIIGKTRLYLTKDAIS